MNCLRSLPDAGLLVRGASTLAADDGFDQLNVRRTFNFVRESIRSSMGWVASEHSDDALRAAVRTCVTTFLTSV
ncbi:phage tail sheath C-terminal domain-containing protein [Streptomyces sp. NPDC093795]|uniref:phage tail sheath C-terminal domain-containing protein n=1 Tax=Streptomyces sp. NPDC093795 TaxID=3366051 RepID=UPI00382BA25F